MKIPLDILDWTRWIIPNHEQYVGGGGFGDAYKAEWINIPATIGPLPDVVVKVMRVIALSPKDSEKRFKVRYNINHGWWQMPMAAQMLLRELSVWKNLQHENIVPFVGICHVHDQLPALVSLWMENGEQNRSLSLCCNCVNILGCITKYLKENPTADKWGMVLGVAKGVEYLHSESFPFFSEALLRKVDLRPLIVHGDIKGVSG